VFSGGGFTRKAQRNWSGREDLNFHPLVPKQITRIVECRTLAFCRVDHQCAARLAPLYCGLRLSTMLRRIDFNFVNGAAIHSIRIFQVKREPRRFLLRVDFGLEHDWLCRIHLSDCRGS